jgi:hypothetical protein
VDGADGLGVASLCDVVVAGHGHGAESNAGTSSPPIEMCFMVFSSFLSMLYE